MTNTPMTPDLHLARTDHDRPSEQQSLCGLPPVMLVIDIEVEQERIVELSAIRFGDGVPEPAMVSTLVNPGYRLCPGAQRNRRRMGMPPFDPDALLAAPRMRQVIPTLLHMASGAVVVAHSAAYERRYLLREFGAYGMGWDYPELCTLRLARMVLRDQRGVAACGLSLSALARRYRIRNPAPHRAAGDALTLVAVVVGLAVECGGDRSFSEAVRSCTRGRRSSRLRLVT